MQADFSRGELAPRLHARIDIAYYKSALKTCTNWTVLKQGGLRKRPGFRMVKEAKDSSKRVRLLPFIFSTQQAYVIEMGDLYARNYANGGLTTTGGGTPTGITKANPAVVTLNAHGFADGDRVYVTAVGGMTEVNNREFTVAGAAANTFQLSGINSTAYSTFTAGGSVKKIVEITTPYTESDVGALDYAQTADVMTLVHGSHKPRELTRTSDTAWTLTSPTFYDGPYLDEPQNNATSVTPSATSAIMPLMTANNAPSGVVTASDAAADVWKLFSQNTGVDFRVDFAPNVAWIEAAPAASAVCDNYAVTAHPKYYAGFSPSAWTFQGWDGSAWVDLDVQKAQSSWGANETRYFTFQNDTAYSKYRLYITGLSADNGWCYISSLTLGYNGDYAPTITLTYSATTGVNGNAGFDANDVGRHIRVMGRDGKWRWFLITAVTSTTVVQGRLYGYALFNKSKVYRWKLGAWRLGQWPALVSFFENRRGFAASAAEPQTVWLTKAFDFYDFGTSQPLVDDDGMRLPILSGKVNALSWLAETERLALGTVGNVRVLGKSNQNQGFGATNYDQKRQVSTGAKRVKPVEIGSVLLFADYYGKSLREFIYDLNQDGYIAPDVTILSDHLLSAGIAEMAYQATPDSIVWIALADGSLVTMTYERDQKVVALTRASVAPGDANTQAYVESVCSIPGATRDEVWIAVRRTIGGVTKRYIESLAPEFENMATADAVFADSALTYSGAATGTVTGLWHLAGQTVNVLADAVVFRALTVSATGTVTLPSGVTASKITVGLPYTATLTTLAINEAGQRDGNGLSRRKTLHDIRISAMESLGLKAKGIASSQSFDVFSRDESDPVGQMNLRTGIYPLQIEMSHRDDGQFTLFSSDPLPCTIRGIIFGADGEP